VRYGIFVCVPRGGCNSADSGLADDHWFASHEVTGCRWHRATKYADLSTFSTERRQEPINVKFALGQTMKAQRGSRGTSTLSLTSALNGGGRLGHGPAVLPPRMTPYPLYRRLSGSQGQAVGVRKISPPPGFDPPTVHPAHSEWLHRLLYRGAQTINMIKLEV